MSFVFFALSTVSALDCADRVIEFEPVAPATERSKAHDKVVGCYWGTWSFYRTGFGKFDVNDIDPSLCTHGFYGFADLHNDTWTVKIWDPWYDQNPNDPGCDDGRFCCYDSYRRFIKLRETHPGFIPMISIGNKYISFSSSMFKTFGTKVDGTPGLEPIQSWLPILKRGKRSWTASAISLTIIRLTVLI